MARRIEDAKVTAGYALSSSSGSGKEWKYFQFHIHDFGNLSSTRNDFVASPEFTCSGHQWELCVYPGGNTQAAEGQVSFFLRHLSQETITTKYDVKIVGKFGDTKLATNMTTDEFSGKQGRGWVNFISRSDILDIPQNILDSNGTLTVVVSIEEEPTTVFVPKNPLFKMIQGMFNDENTADVCFVVSFVDEGKGESQNIKSPVPFYAHRFVLENFSPMLAALCGASNGSGGVVTAPVNDVKTDVFRHLHSYVYGRTIPDEELKAHAKDIIDAANKYSIVNLKLAAEVAYVESTDISLNNAMDILLYADSMNLALLKEAVMNFLADNHREAVAKMSFTDFPGHVVKDLFIAFGRKDTNGTNADELTTLSVNDLRRKLNKMGLEVDGSREVMIESIKSHLKAILE